MGISRPHAPPTRIGLFACLWVLAIAATAAPQSNDAGMFWPQWRGPLATGAAPHGDPPVEWSETKNIRWKVEIPGRASASPIVWGDRVFVLTTLPTGDAVSSGSGGLLRGLLRRLGLEMSVEPTHVQQFTVLAIDRSSGQLVWQHTAREELPHQGTHPTGSLASGSAVTDGEHLWAFFGSRGLYGYDMQGNLIWEHDFGDLNIRQGFGEGSSPALYGDKIIINWDHEGQSFITALDKRTGRQIWRTDRDEATSWSTPLVVEHDGGAQIVTSATDRVRSYDLETGRLIWESDGVTPNAIPSPVAGEGMVYATSGFRGSASWRSAFRLRAAILPVRTRSCGLMIETRRTSHRPSCTAARCTSSRAIPGFSLLTTPGRVGRTIARSGYRASAACTPRLWRPAVACTSPAETARPSSSDTDPNSRFSPATCSTMGLMPRPRSWATRSTCVGVGTSTASPKTRANPDAEPPTPWHGRC